MSKMLLRSVLKKIGWDVHRINRAQVLPPEIPDLECYTGPEDSSRLYRPWKSDAFHALLHPSIMENTMLSPQKLYTLRQLLLTALPVEGDILEAGTCSGGTARLMSDIVSAQAIKKDLWLLDTFDGYRKIDPRLDGTHHEISGCRGKSLEEVRLVLGGTTGTAHLIPGLIPASLAEVHARNLCFAHIDVNLHEPTREATDYCLQRMLPGGIILFDDYNWPATYGARTAIDEMARKWNQQIICLPESTQAFLIRTL